MKKLLLILLCLPMGGFGQSLETTLGVTGDESGESVQQTTDGGYIICWGSELNFNYGENIIYTFNK